MLCLRCGKREQYADNLCEECLTESMQPFSLPKVVRGFICPSCNRISSNTKSWTESDGGPPDAAVTTARNNLSVHQDVRVQSVDLSVDSFDKSVFRVSGKGVGVYKGVILKKDLRTEVRLTKRLCDTCSKQHGNYYEAIIQIRGISDMEQEEVDELLEDIMDRTYDAHAHDSSVFVTKLEKVRGGYDFYMGDRSFSKNLAQGLHNSLGGDFKVSSSLWGRKDGREVYRYTYLVRLPGFLKGDYLVGKDKVYRVLNVKRGVQVLDLKSGRERNLDMQEAMSMNTLKSKDVEKDLVVIMESENEVQVLHPTTMRPVDLVKRIDVDVKDTVKGALIDGEIYLTY